MFEMNSSDISDFKCHTVEKLPNYLRNTNSAVKRTYKPRRKLNITPLRYDTELEEIENEPLPAFQITEEFENSNSSNKLKENCSELSIINESTVNNPENQVAELANNKTDVVHDSFDIDFGVLSLETPVKASQHISDNGDMSQRSVDQKPNTATVITEERRQLDYRFITPKYSKIVPKVQCSVDVKSYLTPRSRDHKLTGRGDPTTPFMSENPPIDQRLERSVEQTGKENGRNKVQFSLPINNILDKNLTFKKIVVNDTEYIVLNLLGRGGSSQVFHCYNMESKMNRAIKCVSLVNPDSASGYINEVKLLEKLQNCDRIVKMYDYEIRESEKCLLVVLEMGGLDLAKILRELSSNTAHLPMYMLLFYWMEMLYAVRQIHSYGIIHSDLKPANFLKAEGGLKLIDFGIASCIQSDMTSVLKTVPEGSFNYISPEALNNEATNATSPSCAKGKFYKISFKSDVWSLGCILYQLVYRKTPFQHIPNMWKKLATVSNPSHTINYPEANWVPVRIIDTVRRCLQYEMKSRPSVDELISEYESIFSGL